MSSPKSKETPDQKIKRLEKVLADERLRNKLLNTIIDISDKQYGTSIRKKYSPKHSGISNKKNKQICQPVIDCLGYQDKRFININNVSLIEKKN